MHQREIKVCGLPIRNQSTEGGMKGGVLHQQLQMGLWYGEIQATSAGCIWQYFLWIPCIVSMLCFYFIMDSLLFQKRSNQLTEPPRPKMTYGAIHPNGYLPKWLVGYRIMNNPSHLPILMSTEPIVPLFVSSSVLSWWQRSKTWKMSLPKSQLSTDMNLGYSCCLVWE